MRNNLGQFIQGHESWLGKKREPFSDEWKQNLTLNHRKYNSPETRRKIGDANRGKKMSAESIEKNRIAQTGKKMSEETKKKLAKAFSGDRNPAWKGGVTSGNQILRRTLEYRAWQTSVFQRDRFVCQMFDCDKTEHYLEAHHIKRFIDSPELRLDINNGITLCKMCHQKTKGKEGKFEKLLAEIIKIKNG
jgi:hypothetical protein